MNDPAKALGVLKEAGFTVNRSDVVAVVVPDRPGGLAEILAVLTNSALNVEYMYAFVQKSEGNAVVIFRFDDTEKALTVLAAAGIRSLGSGEMQQL